MVSDYGLAALAKYKIPEPPRKQAETSPQKGNGSMPNRKPEMSRMIPSTIINQPNHGMATANLRGQSASARYHTPTSVNAPQIILSQ